MKKTELLNKLSRKVNKFGMQVKKHSPELLIGAGVVGVVASTVLACKATTKLDSILEASKEKIDIIHEAAEQGHVNNEEKTPYSVEDSKKDLTIVYSQTAIELAKLYGPAVIVGTLSLTSILMSHRILSKRNVALAAAYATVDRGFKEYRGRVVERFGEEIDRQLKYNIKAKTVENVEVNEKGEETVVTKTVEVVENGVDEYSDYARFFDASSKYWEKDPEYNLMFLKQVEKNANRRLQRDGFLYLNKVYEMLGLPQTKAGQLVGWIYDEECPNGDNKVSLNIYNLHREANRNFVNGFEPVILLDFNVDGNIWELQ